MTDVEPTADPASRTSESRLSRLRGLVARHPLVTVFAVALLIRVTLAVAVFVVSGGTLFYDDDHYTMMSADAAAGDTADWDEFTTRLYRDTWAFTRPLAFAKMIFGSAALTGQLVVALAGAVTAVLTTKLARLAVGNGLAIAAGLIVALLPSQVFWSSLTLKDPFVWMLSVATALTFALAARAKERTWLWFALPPLLVLLDAVRFHSHVIAGWAIAGAIFVIWGLRRPVLLGSWLVVALVLPMVLGHGPGGVDLVRGRSFSHWRALNAIDAETAVVAPVLTEAAAADKAEAAERAAQEVQAQLDETDDSRERARLQAEIEAHRQRAQQLREAQAAAATGEQVVIDAAFGDGDRLNRDASSNLSYLPHGIALMLLQPYPWVAASAPAVRLAQLETVVWYPLLSLALVGLVTVWRRRDVLAAPVLMGGGGLLAAALTEGNFGTAYRHRAEFVWILALLAVLGVHALAERRRHHRSPVTG